MAGGGGGGGTIILQHLLLIKTCNDNFSVAAGCWSFYNVIMMGVRSIFSKARVGLRQGH